MIATSCPFLWYWCVFPPEDFGAVVDAVAMRCVDEFGEPLYTIDYLWPRVADR